MIRFYFGKTTVRAVAALCLLTAASLMSMAAETFKITRDSLAKSATFTVTQTIAPKGGEKFVRVYHILVKGNKARVDYNDQAVGPVRYVANEKGLFFLVPANKTAMKQTMKGGVEEALQLAFSQVKDQMATAKKTGAATISGQPTIVYKDDKTGSLVYLGTRPGFKLPVKTIQTNVGGTTTILVSEIKLNIAVADNEFALPAGTQVMDSGAAPGVPAPR